MKNPVRVLAATGAIAGLVLLAGPASAHVTVNPREAQQGGYAKLTFRVPTESDTLSTTKVEVQLPTDHPLASVSVRPHPGWTYRVEKAKLATPVTTDDGQVTEAVSTITWTAAADAAIKPGEFDEFDVSVGPLPKAASLTFKALQTYSDGSVVRWIDESAAGQPEAEHPAPVLTLTPASDDTATATSSPAPSDPSATSSEDDSKAPLVLSIVALVVAIAAAGLAFVRRRA
jgi:periplasmic copper chaperone A